MFLWFCLAPEASSQVAEPSTSAEAKSSPDEVTQDVGQLSMLLQEDEEEMEASGSKYPYQEQAVVQKLDLDKGNQHIIVQVGIDSKSSGSVLAFYGLSTL